MSALVAPDQMLGLAVLANVPCCGELAPLSVEPGEPVWCPRGCGTRFVLGQVDVRRLWPGEAAG